MLTRINLEDVPHSARRNNRLMKELTDFHKSDWPAAEIDVGHYKSVNTAVNAYRESVKKMRLGLTIIQRGDKAYVLRGGGYVG